MRDMIHPSTSTGSTPSDAEGRLPDPIAPAEAAPLPPMPPVAQLERAAALPGRPGELNRAGDAAARAGNIAVAMDCYMGEAEILLEMGAARRARAVYVKALRLDVRRLDVHERLAELNASLGFPGEARLHFDFAAQGCLHAGEVQRARSLIQRVVELEPAALQPRLRLAEIHLIAEDPASALDQYEIVGDELAQRGQYDEALGVLRKALALSGFRTTTLRAVARVLAASGRAQESVDLVAGRLDQLAEPDADVLAILAECHRASGDAEATGKVLERALEVAPERSDLRWSLVAHHLARGEAEKALDALPEPSAAEAYQAYMALDAVTHIAAGRREILERVLALHEKVGSSPETRVGVLLRILETRLRDHEYAEAEDVLLLLIRLQPRQRTHREGLEFVQLKLHAIEIGDAEDFIAMGALDEAVATLKSAIGTWPRHLRLRRRLVDLLHELDRHEDALEHALALGSAALELDDQAVAEEANGLAGAMVLRLKHGGGRLSPGVAARLGIVLPADEPVALESDDDAETLVAMGWLQPAPPPPAPAASEIVRVDAMQPASPAHADIAQAAEAAAAALVAEPEPVPLASAPRASPNVASAVEDDHEFEVCLSDYDVVVKAPAAAKPPSLVPAASAQAMDGAPAEPSLVAPWVVPAGRPQRLIVFGQPVPDPSAEERFLREAAADWPAVEAHVAVLAAEPSLLGRKEATRLLARFAAAGTGWREDEPPRVDAALVQRHSAAGGNRLVTRMRELLIVRGEPGPLLHAVGCISRLLRDRLSGAAAEVSMESLTTLVAWAAALPCEPAQREAAIESMADDLTSFAFWVSVQQESLPSPARLERAAVTAAWAAGASAGPFPWADAGFRRLVLPTQRRQSDRKRRKAKGNAGPPPAESPLEIMTRHKHLFMPVFQRMPHRAVAWDHFIPIDLARQGLRHGRKVEKAELRWFECIAFLAAVDPSARHAFEKLPPSMKLAEPCLESYRNREFVRTDPRLTAAEVRQLLQLEWLLCAGNRHAAVEVARVFAENRSARIWADACRVAGPAPALREDEGQGNGGRLRLVESR